MKRGIIFRIRVNYEMKTGYPFRMYAVSPNLTDINFFHSRYAIVLLLVPEGFLEWVSVVFNRWRE
jgi:hypothetical protein